MLAAVPVVTQAIVCAVALVGAIVLFLRRFSASKRWLWVALVVCAVDQAAKAAAQPALIEGERVSLLRGLVQLSYLANRAQGFGGTYTGLVWATALFLAALGLLYWRLRSTRYAMSAPVQVGCGLMVGGYLGIVVDRIRLGYVVDFLELGPRAQFVYNLADLAALLGVSVLVARAVQVGGELRRRRAGWKDPVVQ